MLIGGIAAYLAATMACFGAGWLLPGRGLGTLAMRLVLGCALPAVPALWLQGRLRRGGLAWLASSLLAGMMLVGLACLGGAIAMVVGFRVMDP